MTLRLGLSDFVLFISGAQHTYEMVDGVYRVYAPNERKSCFSTFTDFDTTCRSSILMNFVFVFVFFLEFCF